MILMCSIFFYLFLFVSLFLYFMSLYVLNLNIEIFLEYKILVLNSSSIVMMIYIDWITLLFMSFVLFISSMIIKYSSEYMAGDLNINRFIYLVILFVCSMMLMIMSPSLISILLGWDGLGLVSYALVIYYQNIKSANAGMLTALSNRVGDAALLMSIALLLSLGSWNLLNFKEFYFNKNLLLLSSFIFMAAITKSAQIPFSSWLPAAMAAPTPVSSLVHSSTLVTAGVYMLIRFSSMFSSSVFELMMFLSLFTMFMAGLGANFEYDLKKIIALSTLSQLGMMIFILSVGSTDLALFHLLIHALFKALLFMCAGAMIHNLGGNQDIRYMGGLIKFTPMTCTCFNISNLALCGLPFISGFYSKDLIAETISLSNLSLFIYSFFFISVGLTVSYSIRLFYYIFMGNYNYLVLNSYSDNNNNIMLKGMLGLIFLVIMKGSFLSWVIFPTPMYINMPFLMKMLTLVMIGIGSLTGFIIGSFWYGYLLFPYYNINLFWFFASMWNLPFLSTYGLTSVFLKMGKIYYKNFDMGWFEYYGSKNLFYTLKNYSQYSQLMSRHHLKLYLFMFMVFIMIFAF
uniref:NADH-ubiquinone oxidoreductase chain 5 n=1 Tax=Cryptorhynchinae sp. 7 ACP-2013 TaxID=1434468 RepID=A0A3G5FNB1_9CUCU|nr:NADH dehydrogenase subunit 5 [Cryptorhynchinae sp. 7 ACP-2013]